MIALTDMYNHAGAIAEQRAKESLQETLDDICARLTVTPNPSLADPVGVAWGLGQISIQLQHLSADACESIQGKLRQIVGQWLLDAREAA